jgi:di/tricarboxylate transporter
VTTEIILTLSVLLLTIILFVTEIFRVDVTALFIMILLPWLGLVEPLEAFSGFSSNAVLAMIGVMILGYSIDASGAMNRFAAKIERMSSGSEGRMVTLISASVGIVSAFMQNIGATVLFLPGVKKVADRSGISLSRLMMPLGFAAILGGTLTMVASGPLIMLNDLMRQSGGRPFGIFSVTPVGLVLLSLGIIYFLILGRKLLPGKEGSDGRVINLPEEWNLPCRKFIVTVPEASPLAGKTIEEAGLWTDYGVFILAQATDIGIEFAPWRKTVLSAGASYAVNGSKESMDKLIADFGVELEEGSCPLRNIMESDDVGFAELVVRPRSRFAGRTVRLVAVRKTFGVEPIALNSGGKTIRGDISDYPLKDGDAIMVHGSWSAISAMGKSEGFLLASRVPEVRQVSKKPFLSILIFAAGVLLAILGCRLSLAMMTAAAAMIILKVITIDEAYRAVEWRTVFLLAGLLPLGIAMERTGTAELIASQVIAFLGQTHPIVLMYAIAVLATVFTLFMSNVAATVLLVPLVITIAPGLGISPGALAILVAVCASNSFVLPTHQVNALLMTAGGYGNHDYMRAGGPLTLLFIAVVVPMVYALF